MWCLIVLSPLHLISQESKTSIEVYGFIMTDAGYNFNKIDPDWFDVMRPTKLPSQVGQFGSEGNFFFSIRQTRFGIGSSTPTKLGELKTQFDFDLFGFGKNTGQTTFHLINAYGQLGKLLIGQTASIFMDQAVFPATLDYWGPLSRVFIFNIQIRYMPFWEENRRLAFAIERPGATADGGDEETSIQLNDVKPVFRMPNLLGEYRVGGKWGHVQIATLLKLMKWIDVSGSSSQDLSGSTMGWGWTLSSVINAGKKLKLKMQVVHGEGIESHIADAPADVVPQSNPADPIKPIKGIAQPVLGFFSFVEISWSKVLESTIGYSQERVTNGDLQSPDAFRKGQYGLLNLRYLPVPNVMMGVEYQYGRRDNFNSQFHYVGNKVQVSFKYNFSTKLAL